MKRKTEGLMILKAVLLLILAATVIVVVGSNLTGRYYAAQYGGVEETRVALATSCAEDPRQNQAACEWAADRVVPTTNWPAAVSRFLSKVDEEKVAIGLILLIVGLVLIRPSRFQAGRIARAQAR